MSTEHPQSKIQKLPEHLINQIKAGEVIERPANIVKELIENSIDAKSTHIELNLIGHGMDLISVIDNGIGMNAEDLKLAFLRHTTSKLHKFDELYKLTSYGFRGEALGSIASVSQIACSSFKEQLKTGNQILIEGGEIKSEHEVEKTDLISGTKMVIKDLFFNTPVRFKFIQSAQTEKNWIKRIFYSFVLGHPQCYFSFKWDDEEKIIYPALSKDDYLGRIKQMITGSGFDEEILSIDKTFHQIRIRLFLVPKEAKLDYRFSFLLINQRLVLDKGLAKLIKEIIDQVSPQKSYYELLLIDLPTDHLDVNIHPHKTSVKIFESHTLWSFVASCVKEILKSNKPVVLPTESIAPNFTFTNSDISEEGFSHTSYSSHFEALTPKSNINILHDFHEHALLIKITDLNQIFFLMKKKIIQDFKNYVLKLNENQQPLFVTQPLDKNKFSTKLISALQNNHWEIDDIGGSYYLLRSIPKSLANFSITQILPLLGDDEVISNMEDAVWEQIISLFTIQALIENKTLVLCAPPL